MLRLMLLFVLLPSQPAGSNQSAEVQAVCGDRLPSRLPIVLLVELLKLFKLFKLLELFKLLRQRIRRPRSSHGAHAQHFAADAPR